jgi:hypothetical protein
MLSGKNTLPMHARLHMHARLLYDSNVPVLRLKLAELLGADSSCVEQLL